MHDNMSSQALREISPVVLAYVGDAVFELAVRTYIIADGHRRVKDIHHDTVEFVKAESQARVIRQIFDELDEEERDIVKRGRNTKTGVSKHAHLRDYKMSTGFEALLGFLYLKGDLRRLHDLINKSLGTTGDELTEEGEQDR